MAIYAIIDSFFYHSREALKNSCHVVNAARTTTAWSSCRNPCYIDVWRFRVKHIVKLSRAGEMSAILQPVKKIQRRPMESEKDPVIFIVEASSKTIKSCKGWTNRHMEDDQRVSGTQPLLMVMMSAMFGFSPPSSVWLTALSLSVYSERAVSHAELGGEKPKLLHIFLHRIHLPWPGSVLGYVHTTFFCA